MNPPERVPDFANAEQPSPRRVDWRSLLEQAPIPGPPAGFAARLQAAVDREAESARGEAITMQLLLLVLVAVGSAFAIPGLGSGFSALVQQLGDAVPGVLALACAVAAAWAIDVSLRRPRGLLDV